MPETQTHHTVLMIRPWHNRLSGAECYAHFDALPMRVPIAATSGRYAEYWPVDRWDDGRTILHLDRFRFQCQTDDRRSEAYAWEWGYQGESGRVFGTKDLNRYGPSIKAIQRALDRSYREDGAADGVGRFVVRLARVLKLDGIAVLETSQTGTFPSDTEIRERIMPDHYGKAIWLIDKVVTELHQGCAKRLGRVAA